MTPQTVAEIREVHALMGEMPTTVRWGTFSHEAVSVLLAEIDRLKIQHAELLEARLSAIVDRDRLKAFAFESAERLRACSGCLGKAAERKAKECGPECRLHQLVSKFLEMGDAV